MALLGGLNMPAGSDHARGAGASRGRRAEEIVTFELVEEDDPGNTPRGASSKTLRNSQEVVTFELEGEDDGGDAGPGSKRVRNAEEKKL